MNCIDREDAIAALAEDGLEGPEARELEGHLRSCARCQGSYEKWKETFAYVQIPQPDEFDWDEEALRMLELVRTREGRPSGERAPGKPVPGERAPEKLEKPVQVVELAHAARGRVIRFPGHALAAAAMLLLLLPLAARLVLVQEGTGELGPGDLDSADVCSIAVDRLDEIAALVSATSEQRAALDAIRAEGERLTRKARTPEEARRIEKDVRARMRALLSEVQRSKFEASCTGLDPGRGR